MKKTYNKPTIKEIKVEANQAIAACSLTATGYQLSDKWTDVFYETEEAALAAQPDWQSATKDIIFPVYTYEADQYDFGSYKADISGMWADTNKNGNMDDSDIVYNQQGNRPTIAGLNMVMNS